MRMREKEFGRGERERGERHLEVEFVVVVSFSPAPDSQGVPRKSFLRARRENPSLTIEINILLTDILLPHHHHHYPSMMAPAARSPSLSPVHNLQQRRRPLKPLLRRPASSCEVERPSPAGTQSLTPLTLSLCPSTQPEGRCRPCG